LIHILYTIVSYFLSKHFSLDRHIVSITSERKLKITGDMRYGNNMKWPVVNTRD
jgi:hypothetical protein